MSPNHFFPLESFWRLLVLRFNIFIPIASDYTEFVREAVAQKCTVKKVFLEIVQNSQDNICSTVVFNKVKLFKLY